MTNHAILRPLVGLPIAGLIVFSLYTFMQRMIAVDFVPPAATAQRGLKAFVPPDLAEEPVRKSTPKPEKLKLADRPPPLPDIATTTRGLGLPVPVYNASASVGLPVGTLDQMTLTPVAIDEREAEPIRPPVPVYPQTAARRGLEGICEVHFDVDVRGRPYNIQADCSDRIFAQEAERAVTRVQFVPKIVRGRPAERQNVVYPLEFRLKAD